MKQKIFTLIVISLGLMMLFSCDDDDQKLPVSLEWMNYQAKLVGDISREASNNIDNRDPKKYLAIKSYTGEGEVYYMVSDSLTMKTTDPETKEFTTRISKDGYPYFTDTVRCRYQGWLCDLNGNKIIFDGTETTTGTKGPATFLVNQMIDGFATMLQHMKVDEEVKVCIPYRLAYGEGGKTGQSMNDISIPPYTTLWFRIKLIEIKPTNKNEIEGWKNKK